MPDTQMVRVAREAFKKCRPVDRVVCQDFGMQHDDILDQQLEAALQAALSGHVVVPQSALDWLFGEGPDADGKWFGETIGDGIPKLAGRYPRTYWWRSKFRAMIQAAPPVPEMEPR